MTTRRRAVVGDPRIRCEPLSEPELEQFRAAACPDCGGSLREGPHGGLSVNYVCGRCARVFNDTRFFGVDRIVEEPEVTQ